MRLTVEAMELEDIPQVLEVDRESYTLPWPASAYRREILHNRHARYLVCRQSAGDDERADDGESDTRSRLPLPFFRWPRGDARPQREGHIVAYAGMWMMVDEAHITTIAVRESSRGRSIGEIMLASLVDIAYEMGAERVTLEVRVTNDIAQNLYRKYGFAQEGLRKRYYSDNNEDAYIMTTQDIRTQSYRQQFENLLRALAARLQNVPDLAVSAPVLEDLTPSSRLDQHAHSGD